MNGSLQFIICHTDEEFKIAKKLTNDYMVWLDEDLCFQNPEYEMANFNKMYNEPEGCFILAKYNAEIAGGIGVRKLDEEICEMKRLFVYDEFRQLKIGVKLCQELILIAKKLGYRKMRLDTIEKLQKAIRLYKDLGFYEIEAYCENPDETVRYMELNLEQI